MHKSNGTHLPESTFPLSTEERIELRAQSQKPLLKEEERRSLFQEEGLALRVNPDATTTLTGRRIQNNRAKSASETSEQRRIHHIFDGLVLGAFSLQSITKIASALISLTGAFGASVASTAATPVSATDTHNVYDTARVSHATYKQFRQEAEEIALQEKMIGQIEDPVEHMRELQNFAERANDLGMRPHPVTGEFVHCHERVCRMEETIALNSTLIEPQIYGVVVFRPRTDIGLDIPEPKVAVVDQRNINIYETVGKMDMGSVNPRPVAHPAMPYIG